MNTFLANLYLRAITIRDREEGQAMAEYGIILALIAVLVIATVALLGHQILAAFTTITNKLANP
jgi:pilus assembly protein Flp/PilA